MLTSHKITGELPFNFSQVEAEGQALPQGVKFSEIFSAMFGAQPAAEAVSTATPDTMLAEVDADLSIGPKLLSALDLNAGDLEGMSMEEFRQLLPSGLQNLADANPEMTQQIVAKLQANLGGVANGEAEIATISDIQEPTLPAFADDLHAEKATNRFDSIHVGELVKSLAKGKQVESSASEVNHIAANDTSADSVGRKGQTVAETVHEVLGIKLPEAQVSQEMDRRALHHDHRAQVAAEALPPESVSELSIESDELIPVETSLEEFVTVSEDVDQFIEEQTPLTPEALLQSAVQPGISDESNEAVISVQQAPELVGQVASVADYYESGGEPVVETDPAQLGFTVAQNVGQAVETVADASENSQTVAAAMNNRAAQPNVHGSSQTNHQTSWGSQSADNSQAAANQSNTGSQSSANGQQNPGQSNMAQQQMAVKATDEQLLNKPENGDRVLGSDLGLGERRGLLPTGLQTINVPVKSPQWGQAVAHRVTFMANNQIQQAQITLNPEKLGPIQIKLHMDRDQQVHVSMTAQHGTTREAMEMAVPRLREMLEQSGMSLASVDVSDQNSFANQNSEQETSSQTAQSNVGSDMSSHEEETLSSNAVVTDNIVDYYA